jgi:hypothetical protein
MPSTTFVTLAIETDHADTEAQESAARPDKWDWADLLGVSTANALAVHTTTAPLITEPLTEDDIEHLPEGVEPSTYSGPKKVAADSTGFVTVVVQASLAQMLLVRGTRGGDIDEHDYLHDLAFGFGVPCQSEYEVLGVSKVNDLRTTVYVAYSTDLSDFTGDGVEWTDLDFVGAGSAG